jgi:hypothetical protein
MWALPSLLSEGEEYPWSSSRLIRRRPGVDDGDDGDDGDVQEDAPDPTPLSEYTAVDGDSGSDVIAETPLSGQERLHGEYGLRSVEWQGRGVTAEGNAVPCSDIG